MRNILFAISGPSGVGKGTLVKRILSENDNLALSISCTSRKPRRGEENGREYYFVSREEFQQRISENDFLEYDEHFGNYYGTPKSFVLEQLKDKSVILEIDVVGALHAKELMLGECRTVLIMVVPPDFDTLRSRLTGRSSETEEEMLTRMERVKYELSMQDKYDYILVNDDLNEAKERLLNIINQEIIREGDKI
ncbi:MAG: guanylate kinase [Clostridia bacterium]|nr:guanylate kinase [Clostridia bacterium]